MFKYSDHRRSFIWIDTHAFSWSFSLKEISFKGLATPVPFEHFLVSHETAKRIR
jgi:hypothetical protein